LQPIFIPFNRCSAMIKITKQATASRTFFLAGLKVRLGKAFRRLKQPMEIYFSAVHEKNQQPRVKKVLN
jgi:hypothetical protein